MTKPTLAPVLLLAASFLAAWPASAAVVYRSNEGWSVEGQDTPVEGSAAEQMRKAEGLEAAGNSGGAYNAYRGLVKNYGQSALAPKAQRKVAMLLEQVLAPEQYAANVKTKHDSSDLVEFAIKLPGRDEGNSVVHLPVDAKFPKDIYVLDNIPNYLSDYEKKDGWKLLFDGGSSNGWRGAYKTGFPDKDWTVENGTITVHESKGKEGGEAAHNK